MSTIGVQQIAFIFLSGKSLKPLPLFIVSGSRLIQNRLLYPPLGIILFYQKNLISSSVFKKKYLVIQGILQNLKRVISYYICFLFCCFLVQEQDFYIQLVLFLCPAAFLFLDLVLFLALVYFLVQAYSFLFWYVLLYGSEKIEAFCGVFCGTGVADTCCCGTAITPPGCPCGTGVADTLPYSIVTAGLCYHTTRLLLQRITSLTL